MPLHGHRQQAGACRSTCLVVALTALLSGCASPESGGPWIHWVCDSQTELLWRHVNGKPDRVELRLDGATHIYYLTEQEAGSGVIYSDGELVFHTKGQQGLLYWAETDELIGSGCQQPGK
ncbi:MliC family protein [Pseudomonas sp. N040]|uniref:MliC family protein n=1 Tax=Pseudomonas sp. N040 TaxID=2785325 RepID=UPI0018A2E33C|nr:MliC family protein [Pseudomonas sp. N040]MBF7729970.1 MliC family protein [Pseudomonas sp. N040]MBW7013612.1 MliC family protein [Pseudomonas sp. N040]